MFKIVSSYKELVLPKVHISLAMVVDQMSAQDFNLGPNGFQQNDLTALSRATTMQQAELILKRLVDNSDKQVSNLPKNIPLKDCFNYIKPRYAQSELECALFAEVVAQYEQNKINTELSSKLVDKPADVPSVESSNVES